MGKYAPKGAFFIGVQMMTDYELQANETIRTAHTYPGISQLQLLVIVAILILLAIILSHYSHVEAIPECEIVVKSQCITQP